MKRSIINKLDMLKRVDRFILDHPITPEIARLTAAHTEVTTVIAALDSAAEQQLSGKGQSMGGVDLRQSTAHDLRSYLKDVCRTGRSLQDVNPGTRASFLLPKSGSYPALLASARSIIEAATPIAASFQDAGLATTFIADLNALLTAFETATGQKYGGLFTGVMGTAIQKARAAIGLMAADKIDAIVRNHFRTNPEMLAVWASARHIQVPPKTTTETPEPAPTMSASTSTSPASTGGMSGTDGVTSNANSNAVAIV